MLLPLHMRARMGAVITLTTIVLGMVAICGTATRAEPAMLRVALAPFDAPVDGPVEAAPATAPFGLMHPALETAPALAMSAKWRSLQSTVAIELRSMTLCRGQRDACPPPAARFLDIIDAAKAETGRARVGRINRAVNLAIRPARDSELFGVPDVWQSPLMTFANGAGDCEDYAIAKYVALLEAGISASDLKLVIVHDARIDQDHAVAAARVDGEWLILDSRKMLLLTDTQASNLKPLIAFGEETPAPSPIRDAGLGMRFVGLTAVAG